jgi:hypothetical protein
MRPWQFDLFPLDDDPPRKADPAEPCFDFEFVLHYNTGRALLVSERADSLQIWLPIVDRMQVIEAGRDVTTVDKRDGSSVVRPIVLVKGVPAWLVSEKGLITRSEAK